MPRNKSNINILKQITLPTKLPAKLKPKELRAKFPKAKIAKGLSNKRMIAFKRAQRMPKVVSTKINIKASPINAAKIKTFFAVRDAPSVTAAIDKSYKKNLGAYVGTSHSVMTTLAYIEMQAEFKKRLRAARGPRGKLKVTQEWSKVVKAASAVNKIAGGGALSEAKLNGMAKALRSNKAHFKEALEMKNSSIASAAQTLTPRTKINAAILADTLLDAARNNGVIDAGSDICDTPIEGSYTQQYSNSFSIKVNYRVWCPTWRKPLRTCKRTITLAGVSFNMGIQVGYRVTCCGAVVWGQGYVNACGTIIGIKACAGCEASVVGVAGIGRTPISGGQCDYGVGAVATVTCKVGGVKVLNVKYTFGFTVKAPCPPASLPC